MGVERGAVLRHRALIQIIGEPFEKLLALHRPIVPSTARRLALPRSSKVARCRSFTCPL
jgi:hypothetical protein